MKKSSLSVQPLTGPRPSLPPEWILETCIVTLIPRPPFHAVWPPWLLDDVRHRTGPNQRPSGPWWLPDSAGGCMGTWCMGTWAHGRMGTWAHECMGAYGCMGAWVHERTDTVWKQTTRLAGHNIMCVLASAGYCGHAQLCWTPAQDPEAVLMHRGPVRYRITLSPLIGRWGDHTLVGLLLL